MRTLSTAAIAISIAFTATLAHGSETGAINQTVRTWYAKFNAGDKAGALALCAEKGSIIDEFAPFRWTSFSDWFKAYGVYASQNGIAASKVTFDRFAHVNIDSGRAYVAGSATYSYKEGDKRHVEPGMNVLTLEKTPAGWRIASVAWFGRNGADMGADATSIGNTVNSFASLSAPPSPPPIAIVDEFAPYQWEGAGANADWSAGLAKLTAAGGVTGMALKLDKPSQLMVNGDWAYAVYPTVITSQHHGKSSAEHGGFAFTLQKTDAAWHIVSWAWATK
jgi:ketosteroid isomerase-like protein